VNPSAKQGLRHARRWSLDLLTFFFNDDKVGEAADIARKQIERALPGDPV
jgi:hypothetical protein